MAKSDIESWAHAWSRREYPCPLDGRKTSYSDQESVREDAGRDMAPSWERITKDGATVADVDDLMAEAEGHVIYNRSKLSDARSVLDRELYRADLTYWGRMVQGYKALKTRLQQDAVMSTTVLRPAEAVL